MNVSELYNLFDQRRIELGLSQADVGRIAFDRPGDTSLQNMRRGSSPSYERVERLAEVLGLECYVGPPRENRPVCQGAINGNDYAEITRLDVSAAAGAGVQNDSENAVGTLAFRKDWLTARGLSATDVVMINVRGDSMLPLIFDGDTVMVDTSQTSPVIRPRDKLGNRRSDIYAIVQDQHTRIKWVERPNVETLILYSENTLSYAPEVIVGREIEDIKLVGKVVWWGHTVT